MMVGAFALLVFVIKLLRDNQAANAFPRSKEDL